MYGWVKFKSKLESFFDNVNIVCLDSTLWMSGYRYTDIAGELAPFQPDTRRSPEA